MTRAYCIKFGLSLLLVIAGAGLVNWVVDPYGIWKSPIIQGVNSSKYSGFNIRIPKFVEWANWTKAPHTILLGTSRTAGGLRADHPAFSDGTTYNMALGGQPMRESLLLFKHAIKAGHLRRAVIGLDFFVFNAYWASDVGDPARLNLGGNLDLLFRSSTFSDSVTTFRQSWVAKKHLNMVESQPRNTLQQQSRAGLSTSRAHVQRASLIQHGVATRQYFLNVEQTYVTFYRPPPFHIYEFSNFKTKDDTLEDFRELLRAAYEHDIEVKLFISPAHAWHWQGIANAGLWEKWEAWKRKLVKIGADEANRAQKPKYPLWDFSGYNSINTETVPPRGASIPMLWYTDPSHYNPACGDLILDRLAEHPRLGAPIPQDFGIPIGEWNIEARLVEIRQARQHYAGSHVLDIQDLANISQQAWN